MGDGIGVVGAADGAPAYVYVVPVHQEERSLGANVRRILARFVDEPDRICVALGVNGCTDRSLDIARELVAANPERVIVGATDEAGLGHGLALAFETYIAARPEPVDSRFVVLTAADLPFGFTDLDAFEACLRAEPKLACAVGSKAHPASRVRTSFVRSAATRAYGLARRGLLGMRIGDSQGSIFLRDAVARTWIPRVQARNFFFSTELVYHVGRAGHRIEELPVELQASRRPSTVRPLAHGLPMLRQLVELRRRTQR